MFTLDDYEDEILEKLTVFFYDNGESVSEDTLEELAVEIAALVEKTE